MTKHNQSDTALETLFESTRAFLKKCSSSFYDDTYTVRIDFDDKLKLNLKFNHDNLVDHSYNDQDYEDDYEDRYEDDEVELWLSLRASEELDLLLINVFISYFNLLGFDEEKLRSFGFREVSISPEFGVKLTVGERKFLIPEHLRFSRTIDGGDQVCYPRGDVHSLEKVVRSHVVNIFDEYLDRSNFPGSLCRYLNDVIRFGFSEKHLYLKDSDITFYSSSLVINRAKNALDVIIKLHNMALSISEGNQLSVTFVTDSRDSIIEILNGPLFHGGILKWTLVGGETIIPEYIADRLCMVKKIKFTSYILLKHENSPL